MSRLLDADALKQRFADMQKYERCACNFVDDGGVPATEWYCVEDALENAPTIDAIPVEVAAKKLQRSFHSENWESWAEWLRGNYTDEDFVAHKDDKHNAIPVEWLDEEIRGYASALKTTELHALLVVKRLWEQDQNEPKEG